MKHTLIASQSQLTAFCDRLADCSTIAFDTEFVSEFTYRPELCLVQVAAGGELAAIDALAVDDLAPFWSRLIAPGRETVVHAGRHELLFCVDSVGQPPAGMFDVQLAAGLVGFEYPAGYGTLVARLLGTAPEKHETRTDWRRRPLSNKQIEYALNDVRDLPEMRDRLRGRLEQLGRLEWFAGEMSESIRQAMTSRDGSRWTRVAGSSNLTGRSLAIVRELWLWRESEADRRNCPVKRVLRDDLIVELARRRSADQASIRAIRGLERGDLKSMIPGIAAAIEQALKSPEPDRAAPPRRDSGPQLTMLTQFISSALVSICRDAQVSPALVGTASDVRDFIAWRTGEAEQAGPPLLAQGWRAEVVGRQLDDLLSGKTSIRIGDPTAEQPLIFEQGVEKKPRRQ